MSEHTKDPWRVTRTGSGGIIVRMESAKKTRFCASQYAAIGGFDRSDPEQLADALLNACLVAAAPELLEALEALVNDFGQYGYGGKFEDGECRVIDMARNAIAKAIGDKL